MRFEVQHVKSGEGGKKWSSRILRHHLGVELTCGTDTCFYDVNRLSLWLLYDSLPRTEVM